MIQTNKDKLDLMKNGIGGIIKLSSSNYYAVFINYKRGATMNYDGKVVFLELQIGNNLDKIFFNQEYLVIKETDDFLYAIALRSIDYSDSVRNFNYGFDLIYKSGIKITNDYYDKEIFNQYYNNVKKWSNSSFRGRLFKEKMVRTLRILEQTKQLFA
jgi:hypothetical protein